MLLFIGFSSRVKVWKKSFHVISEYMHFVKYIPSQKGLERMRQFAAYIRARVDFNLFMFDGTLCIFGVAFRRFARRFQMTGTIICNNHCTQTLFPRVGQMKFCPTRFQIGRLCTGVQVNPAATGAISRTQHPPKAGCIPLVQNKTTPFQTPDEDLKSWASWTPKRPFVPLRETHSNQP